MDGAKFKFNLTTLHHRQEKAFDLLSERDLNKTLWPFWFMNADKYD